jgi:alkylhydroperoxidase family enzyme
MNLRDPLQPERGWAAALSARLAPPPQRRRGLIVRGLSLISGWFGRPELPDLFPVLGIHRRLLLPWLWFASRLMPYGRLPDRVRELLILRTGWNCRCRYEWGQHVDLALRTGLQDTDILCASIGPQAFTDPVKRDLIQACDELCANHVISDATWLALCADWDEADLIEIAMLVGHYRMLAGFINSAGLVLEGPTEAVLQAFHVRVAQASSTRLREAG